MPELVKQADAEEQLSDDETGNGLLGISHSHRHQRTKTDADESPEQRDQLGAVRCTDISRNDRGIRDLCEGCVTRKDQQSRNR